MKELTVFRNVEERFMIRHYMARENGPWFVANDVLTSIGYAKNTTLINVMSLVKPEYKTRQWVYLHSENHMGAMCYIVTGEGVFDILDHLKTHKPRIERFDEWFRNDVLSVIKGQAYVPDSYSEPKQESEQELSPGLSIGELMSEYVHSKAKTAFLMRQIRAYFQTGSQEAD